MSERLRIDVAGRPLDIEHVFVGAADGPWLVFLHEGLGSVSMWRDFPAQLCEASGHRGLVWSRPGYGRSTPRPPAEKWAPDFMHRQAREVLPALLDALGAPPRYALLGHSDGGSIALIHAGIAPQRVERCIVLAPHIVVEQQSVDSIAATRRTYLETDLRGRLARHHADPESAFWGWNDIWLNPAFRDWTLSADLPAIRCPVLAVQGVDDEYGTMTQIDGIAAALPAGQCRLLKLPDCGHSPHRDQPQAVIAAASQFLLSATPQH
ncbi:alpha/beta hydrolase [uncultured Methylibium sp.]|uniref:alpha/beta fold hydrolase n=1 Tax=uncultured Methylibium sp. TaxID=381093 RepID=UPI0025FE8CB4|nr:alpha/beta hydrolase [uncultured Methylibium sp.]